MVELAKFTMRWNGTPGGTGYSNFFMGDFASGPITTATLSGASQKINTLIQAIVPNIPAQVSLELLADVEVVGSTDGKLIRFMTNPNYSSRVGTGTGAYSAAAGGVINWQTPAVRNSRRIRGRTFLVPFAGSSLATNGTIDDTKLQALRTAVNLFVNDNTNPGYFGVFARPSSKGATDGQWAIATSGNVPDKTAILRSRRD